MAFSGVVLVVSGFANAGLISISASNLASDSTNLDFEAALSGAISSNNVYFQNFGLTSVDLIGNFNNLGDQWNSGTDGKGLASQDGVLTVVDFNDNIDHLSGDAGFLFSFQKSFTQFGFQLVDQINFNTKVESFFNGALVDSIIYNPTGGFPNPQVFFQSDTQINAFSVIHIGVSSGWGLDNITIADVAEVPEPSTLAIFVLGLMGLASRRFMKKS